MSIRINSTFAGGTVIAGIVAGLLSRAADADAARTPDFASDHQRHRLFAEVQRVLSVATLITILAVIPVQARRAGPR